MSLERWSLPVAFAVVVCAGSLVWRSHAHEIITTRITYNKEVVRIFAQSCLGCHREGGVAPMSLGTYAEARPWAKAIKEEVLERRMPPWPAVAGYNEFANDRRLADREVDLITAWVDGGAPKGDDKDLPELEPTAGGTWPLGKPDRVLEPARGFTIEAGSGDQRRCFVLLPRTSRETWIRALDLRPSAASLVRGALVWIDTTRRSGEYVPADPGTNYACSGGPGMMPAATLGCWGWTPATAPAPLPEGSGLRLPPGARLVVEVSYRATEAAAVDRPRLALYFSRQAPAKPLRSLTVRSSDFEIPAGERSYPVRAAMTIDRDAEAVAVLPRMRFLGRSIEVTAVRPDGTREVMVWIRDYDPSADTNYVFRQPIALPRGTRVEVTGYFDNSEGNPRNPSSPPRPVRAGEAMGDETCLAYLTYVARNETSSRAAARH